MKRAEEERDEMEVATTYNQTREQSVMEARKCSKDRISRIRSASNDAQLLSCKYVNAK